MEKLRMVVPTMEHQAKAEAFKAEFFTYGETVINGSALLDQMEYGDWLAWVARNRNPDTVREDWVQADTFFALRESDGELVGVIDIRHHLGNAFLTEYGGHIGYAVRPCERRKGYATQMLHLTLAYARELGLDRVMLGCYTENTASKKVIEKCGGVCTQRKPYLDGKEMDVYWIAL